MGTWARSKHITMKKNNKTVTVLLIAATIALLGITIKAHAAMAQMTMASTTLQPIEQIVVVKKDILTKRQRAWIGALAWCESRHRDGAVNKVDRDGTPSYGRYQFKPSTFNYFMKKYELGTSTNYVDGDLQEKIVEQMIVRNDVKWSTQFPDCVKKNGIPPRD